MIELVARDGNAVHFRLSGKISDEDYEQVLIPTISGILDWHSKVNSVIEFSDEYEGYELGAMWEDTKFGLKHKDDFARVAVVGASKWIQWGVKIGEKMMDGELHTFPAGESEAGWAWVRS